MIYHPSSIQKYCSGRKFLSKHYCSLTIHLGYPRVLMEMCNDINVGLMLANTTFILQPIDQGIILTFKSYYLRNTFNKAIAVIDSNSSDRSQQSRLKTFWEAFTILDAIENISNSFKEIKISKSLAKVDSGLHGWLWGVQDFSRGNNCRCGANNKRTTIRSGDRICDWSAASFGKTLMDESCFLCLRRESDFLR